jgi:hypothetical protein
MDQTSFWITVKFDQITMSRLYVRIEGFETLISEESTKQGDPVALQYRVPSRPFWLPAAVPDRHTFRHPRDITLVGPLEDVFQALACMGGSLGSGNDGMPSSAN